MAQRSNRLTSRVAPLLGVVLCACLSLSAAEHPVRCLVVHSYHPSYRWTDDQSIGILDGLAKHGLATSDIAVEYLDAKRLPDLRHGEELARLFAAKYRSAQLGCVVTTGNAALAFCLERRDQLFPGAPIVFCGVNGYHPDLIAGHARVTGVAEHTDVIGTLRVGLGLFPRTSAVVVVHDQTVTGLSLRRDFDQVAAGLPPALPVRFLTGMSQEELQAALRRCRPDELVLLLSFATDRLGRVVEQSDEARLVQEACPAPLFALHANRLGHGVLGGMLLSGQAHGEQAGQIAGAILAGEDPANLPVVIEPAGRPMFDCQELTTWGIAIEALPKDSVLINRARSVWTEYRELVLASAAVVALLLTIIVALVLTSIAHRRLTARLALSERRFRDLIQYLPVPLGVVGRDGRILLFNQAFTREFGWRIDDVPDLDAWWPKAYPDPKVRSEVMSAWQRQLPDIAAGVETSVVQVPLTTRDGARRSVDCLVRQSGDDYITSFIDVTDRQRTQAGLIAAASHWQSTFDAVSDAIWLLDADLRLLRSNRAAETMQASHEELSIAMCMHCGTAGASACVVRRSRRSLRQEVGEMRLGDRLYEAFADPVLDATGAFAGCVHLITDVTEVRALQNALRQSEKMHAIGQLAGGVAHDFNNQLTGIVGYAELLLQRNAAHEQRTLVEGILVASQRAADLTSKLLAFARKGTNQQIAVDVHVLIRETATMLAHTIDPRVRLELSLEAAAATIEGDPSQLQNALLNLGLNARDAMPEGGVLGYATSLIDLDEESVKAQRYHELSPGRFLRIVVEDSGTGMPEEVRCHLFEPFFTTQGPGKGTGMGLAAVYGTVCSHGGTIFVDTAVGRGTTFTILLPLAVEIAAVVTKIAGPAPRRLRILVADDDETVRQLTFQTLMMDGHQVMTAPDGVDALTLYRQHWRELDLVILDMLMPRMNGADCLRAMRQCNPEVRALIASGYHDHGLAQQLTGSGRLDIIAKPFRHEQLAERIAALTR